MGHDSHLPHHEDTAPIPAPEHGEHIELPAAPQPERRTLMAAFAGILVAFTMLFAFGLTPRLLRAHQLREAAASTESNSAPKVEVTKPRLWDGAATVSLPGSIEALRETWIYARAAGYVRDWNVEIGDEVAEGQALLELDTPELDAELVQARANLAQSQTAVDLAKANRDLAHVTANRYEKLGPSGVASQQEVEERRTQLAVAQANVRAAESAVESQRANVNRLVDLKSFSKVGAPFAGRVTARNVEKGQLVNAGAAGGQGLYRLAHVETVRVFVHVPQDSAALVQIGQPVSVTLRDQPGHVFTGKVTHTAGALDVASRSLNTEVQIPNADHALLAGMYAQVAIQVGGQQHGLRVPSAALVADAHGTRLLVVDAAQKLKSVPIQVGRDLGTEIEVVSGLKGDEQVVVSSPAGTAEGTVVQIIHRDGSHS
jgi:membrane fusion protein (multidrug efflux system)